MWKQINVKKKKTTDGVFSDNLPKGKHIKDKF